MPRKAKSETTPTPEEARAQRSAARRAKRATVPKAKAAKRAAAPETPTTAPKRGPGRPAKGDEGRQYPPAKLTAGKKPTDENDLALYDAIKLIQKTTKENFVRRGVLTLYLVHVVKIAENTPQANDFVADAVDAGALKGVAA